MNSRKIDDLDPTVRHICNQHIFECRNRGIELLVTSTWRDFEAQDALYAIGRTVEPQRRTVTNARGGQSWHNFKCAYDVVPLVMGKAVWDATDPLWKMVISVGIAVGAEAGADWKSFPDLPHFQMRPADIHNHPITLDVALDRWNENGSIFLI